MNIWFVISFICLTIAAILVLVGTTDAKFVPFFVLLGAAFFALGHGASGSININRSA